MPTRRDLLVAATLIVLFFVANRAAYQGYFSGDDIDNIDWTSRAGSSVFVRGLMTLQFNPDNFRPVGHAFFRFMGATADLHFAPYLAVLQMLHLSVALLVFFLARGFDTSKAAAAIGSLFFVFHMGLFGAFWKPMYIFDVLCAFFCCLSVLAWKRSGVLWWIVSFLCFWLAYKSKEVAVMLPAVLLVVEFVTRERRWLRALPFLGVSLVFGAQAVLYSLMASFNHTTGPYQLRVTPQTLAATAAFYGEHLFLSSWGLILLAAVLFFARSRWGAVAAFFFLVPMLVLPGRTFSVYLYVPLAFLAIAVASAADRSVKLGGLFVVGWLGINFLEMRKLRSVALAEAHDARSYAETVQGRAIDAKEIRFDGYPLQLNSWGVKALSELLLHPDGYERGTVTLSWQPAEHKLYVFDDTPVPYLDMRVGTPIQKSDEGWYAPETDYRWTRSRALLHLVRPAEAMAFEWKVQLPKEQLTAANGKVVVEILLGGKRLPTATLTEPGWRTIQNKALPATDKLVVVEIRVTPPFRPSGDGRELGIAVGAIGFR